jgi:uncharacterized membrane protein YuzA (DUF378 family)
MGLLHSGNRYRIGVLPSAGHTREPPKPAPRAKVSALREATGEKSLIIRNPDLTPDLRTFARIALFRPCRLFFTEIIVFMVSVMSAVAFGLIYLFAEALPVVYGSFGFSDKQSSLAFIAIGIGLLWYIYPFVR